MIGTAVLTVRLLHLAPSRAEPRRHIPAAISKDASSLPQRIHGIASARDVLDYSAV